MAPRERRQIRKLHFPAVEQFVSKWSPLFDSMLSVSSHLTFLILNTGGYVKCNPHSAAQIGNDVFHYDKKGKEFSTQSFMTMIKVVLSDTTTIFSMPLHEPLER